MDDLISRQTAIEAMSESLKRVFPEHRQIAEKCLNVLPSVTPERKTGKWINGYCSECGKHAPFWAMASTYYKSSFCPNCGAKMDEDEKTAGAEQCVI